MRITFLVRKHRSITTFVMFAAFSLGIVSSTLGLAPKAYAATSSPGPRVSFTFDDGLKSAVSAAAPALQAYGFTGTDYVTTGCIGTTGTCAANEDASYMTWAQVKTLQDTYHWEIGAHSVTHPLMTTLTATQLHNEVANSKAALVSHGFNPTAFATPYGDYNNAVIAEIAKSFSSHRPFADQENPNVYPYNDYLLYVKQVQAGVSVATVKQYIDQAKANNQWLVLVFHDIKTTASTNPDDYEYSTANLKQIAAYVKAQNIPVTNITDGLAGGTNLMPNSTFDNGLSNGWATDLAANVTKDVANRGSYPSSANSIKLVANATKSVHLFSPLMSVDATKTYTTKSFLNVTAIKSGEVTYYIDEYDANNNWISGQYKLGEKNTNVENINIRYTPTSTNVKKIRYQVAVGANTGITAYVDNVQLIQN